MIINFEFQRPASDALTALEQFSSATIHEATGQRGALPAALKPIDAAMRLCGPALTVYCPRGDNLMLHAAIAGAKPGDVLVVDHEGALDDGPFGDILATACIAKGIVGLVIDGCVRDLTAIRRLGFPVFARGACIVGTAKVRHGTIGQTITLGGLSIAPGDAILGDEDGLVVVPRLELAATIVASFEREATEEELRQAIRSGASTVELLHLEGCLMQPTQGQS